MPSISNAIFSNLSNIFRFSNQVVWMPEKNALILRILMDIVNIITDLWIPTVLKHVIFVVGIDHILFLSVAR